MTNRNLAFAGAGILVLGLFAPSVTVPIVGSVNLFNNGSNLVATIILIFAIIGGVLALVNREGDIIWPGGAAAILVAVLFLNFQYRISQMKASLQTGLADNPFAGIAQAAAGAVQVQWGWVILAGGVGLLIYAAARARKEASEPVFAFASSPSRGVAIVSVVLLVVALALTFWNDITTRQAAVTPVPGAVPAVNPTEEAVAKNKLDAEKAAYIRDNLTLYDVTAKYYESMLDGRVPGVDFKIKNKGARTLSGVDVKVEFLDDAGKPIAEEMYYPVNASSFTGNKAPLRPNYVWTQEQGQFYTAKSVPDEWKTGAVKASITDIEFAPKE